MSDARSSAAAEEPDAPLHSTPPPASWVPVVPPLPCGCGFYRRPDEEGGGIVEYTCSMEHFTAEE